MTVFVALLKEEWRLQSTLFGGKRFLLFPVIVALSTAGVAEALTTTGISIGDVVRGLHVLALGFGLYTGTAGFVGSDMLENVFGDITSVLASAATLPLSKRRLLGAFLVKDGLYYGCYVLFPMAVGIGPFADAGASAPLQIAAFWLSLLLAFAAGMTATTTAIALRTREAPGWAIAAGVVGVPILVWRADLLGPALDAMITDGGTVADGPVLATLVATVGVAAIAGFDPTYRRPTRTTRSRFDAIVDRLPTAESPLVTKTLLDLHRSGGGVWKPLVSAGILFALVAVLVDVVARITSIEPAPGIFFGSVLALAAFTTYNWLTQFDALEAYLAYPVAIEDVFRAKRIAFAIVGAPAVALPYVVALALYRAAPIDALAGAAVLAGYSAYFYGLTVWIAGFDPNEFLFDGVRFGAFTAGVAVPMVPTLVAGFVVVPPTPAVAGAVGALGAVFGVVGFVLSKRAGPRWDRYYRRE